MAGSDGDFVTEGFEFADEVAFVGVGVVEVAGKVLHADVTLV